MQLTIPPLRTLRIILLVTWTLVAAAGFAVEIIYNTRDFTTTPRWLVLLSLSYENNIPNWYSSCILFSCSAVLACIGARPAGERHGHGFHWWLLGAGFLYISIDESIGIHEQMNLWFQTGGILYYGWVIPMAGLVLVLGLVFLKFVFALPKATRRRFVIAGIIYVGGALVMELPLGYLADKEGTENGLGYAMIDGIEESMELLGSTLFLLALLQYTESDQKSASAKAPSSDPANAAG